MGISVDQFVPADVSVNVMLGVSAGASAGVLVRVAVVASMHVFVIDLGFAVDAAVEVAVEIAVEIAVDRVVKISQENGMASAMGLDDVLMVAAARCYCLGNVGGSLLIVWGSPWSVCGCQWNVVTAAVECRGGPRTLPGYSANNGNTVHSSVQLGHKARQKKYPRGTTWYTATGTAGTSLIQDNRYHIRYAWCQVFMTCAVHCKQFSASRAITSGEATAFLGASFSTLERAHSFF